MNRSPWQAALLKKVINASPLLREQHEQAHRFMKIRSHPDGIPTQSHWKRSFSTLTWRTQSPCPACKPRWTLWKGCSFKSWKAVSWCRPGQAMCQVKAADLAARVLRMMRWTESARCTAKKKYMCYTYMYQFISIYHMSWFVNSSSVLWTYIILVWLVTRSCKYMQETCICQGWLVYSRSKRAAGVLTEQHQPMMTNVELRHGDMVCCGDQLMLGCFEIASNLPKLGDRTSHHPTQLMFRDSHQPQAVLEETDLSSKLQKVRFPATGSLLTFWTPKCGIIYSNIFIHIYIYTKVIQSVLYIP